MEILYDFGKEIRGIAIDSEDNIFVANFDNNSIDKVSLKHIIHWLGIENKLFL
jgi:hypothetical protein